MSAGATLPASFPKGHVYTVATGGTSASGLCYSPKGLVAWTWSPKSGVKTSTKLLKGDDEAPASPKKRLDAWNKAHGWDATLPAKPFASHTAYHVFASGLSKDGGTVVGHYGSPEVEGRFG